MAKINKKYKKLTDKYMEKLGENLPEDEWELIERTVAKSGNLNDVEAVKLFELLFCEVSELESNSDD